MKRLFHISSGGALFNNSTNLDYNIATQIQMTGDDTAHLTVGRQLVSGAAAALSLQNDERRKAKESRDRAVFDEMLRSLTDELELAREARTALEAALAEEFGANFVEDNAALYIDPETLTRRAGESDDQYRIRMERELAELMLNPDGTIKPEFAHLDIAKWLWAQDEITRLINEINALENDNSAAELRTGYDTDHSTKTAASASQFGIALSDIEQSSGEDAFAGLAARAGLSKP